METICLLLAYKIKYPENFFILRGNHECASINRIYGFYDECKRRYNIKLWKTFTDCFNCLPIAAIIDEKIFTMHGGLSPDLNSMEQIRRVMRPTDVSQSLSFVLSYLGRCAAHLLRLLCRSTDMPRSLTAACSATCCGQTRTKTSPAGVKTTVASLSPLGLMLSHAFSRSMTWTSSVVRTKSLRMATSFSQNDSWSRSSVRLTIAASSTTLAP